MIASDYTLANTQFFGVKVRLVRPGLVAIAGTKIDDGYRMRGGVRLVDISNPANPVLVGEMLVPANTGFYGMAVNGDYLYVAAGPLGIHVLNVADATNPFLASTYNLPGPGWCNDVFIDGNLAFVADGQVGIQILDISDATQPKLLGGVDTPVHAREVIVRDGLAFVADYHGLCVLDVSLPAEPRLMAGVRTLALGLKVQGDYAYIATSSNGMLVVDISSPANPKVAGHLPNTYVSDPPTLYPATVRLDVSGAACAWANAADGLILVDITDPKSPRRLRKVLVPGAAYDVIIVGDWAVVAQSKTTIFTHQMEG